MDKFERLETKNKRPTKALKKKKTFDLYGKMSAKHLRTCEKHLTQFEYVKS